MVRCHVCDTWTSNRTKVAVVMQEKVQKWIEQNFVINDIRIEDFPLFPGGKRIIDRNNDEMVVYWDFLHNKIDYVFPKK